MRLTTAELNKKIEELEERVEDIAEDVFLLKVFISAATAQAEDYKKRLHAIMRKEGR